MALHYSSEHKGCSHYVTGSAALFGRLLLEPGAEVPAVRQDGGQLLYVADGLLEVADADGRSCREVGAGCLVLMPSAGAPNVRARAAAHVVTCLMPVQVPLCDRYDLEQLRRDVATAPDGLTPPPTHLPARVCKCTY